MKWVGGKRKLAPEILKHLPKVIEGTYYEPFAGGAAIFCALWNKNSIRGRVVLADQNPDLMSLYNDVRQSPGKLVEDLKKYEHSYRAGDASQLYYQERERWNAGERSAARFVFLKQTAFNGLWRVNQRGELNAAWGKYPSPLLCDEGNIKAWNTALQAAQLLHVNALTWDAKPKAGDVVYVDPPYVGTFDRYTDNGFTDEQQKLLVMKLATWSRQGAVVAYSNSAEAEPLVRKLWPEARIIQLETTYNVNRDGAGRSGKKELLAVTARQ